MTCRCPFLRPQNQGLSTAGGFREKPNKGAYGVPNVIRIRAKRLITSLYLMKVPMDADFVNSNSRITEIGRTVG